MSDLPPLRGTPKQVKWATPIRANALEQKFNVHSLELLRTIDDSTWWIANRVSGDKLVMTFKDPAPHQKVGGPPPPAKSSAPSAEYIDAMTPLNVMPRQDTTKRVQRLLGEPRAGEDGDENDLPSGGVGPKPHDAELFAASVCRHPLLAEIAVVATLARLYKGEVGDMLKWRARHKLEKVRETIIAEMDKDIDGLRRILK